MEGKHIADTLTLAYICIAMIPFLLFEIGKEFKTGLYDRLKSTLIIWWSAYVLLLTMIIMLGVHDGSSFIYVSF